MIDSDIPDQETGPDSSLGDPQPPTDNVRSLLRQGLLAARDRRYVEALGWFRAARDKDADNVVALLWLAWLVPSRQESLKLLSRVLELDPKNERARAALRWARNLPVDQSSEETPASSASAPGTPTRSELLRDALDSSEAQEKARSGIAAHRARRFIGPLGLLLMSAVCLFLAGAVFVAQYSPAWVSARLLSTTTPELTTLDPTSLGSQSEPAATVTPTATSTTIASSTPSPAARPGSAARAGEASTPALQVPSPQPSAPSPQPPASSPQPSAAYPQGLLAAAPKNEKWIDVDLTHQRITAYEGTTAVFESVVSTGLTNTPTIVGQFRIYLKLSATDMAGPGYYLPDVPYTMYFYRGYALHGTYWHSNFGQPMSHGCVNLRTEDAKWLFNWAAPLLPTSATSVRSSGANPGTLVVVHY